MAIRVTVKEGDIFEVPLDNNKKGYFQFIMLDLTQLNSEVIRIFKKRYEANEAPDLEDVVKDEVQRYAHVVIKFGVKMNLWDKVGNVGLESVIEAPYFRMADDDDDPNVQWKRSSKWSVWQVGKDFQSVGRLTDSYKNYDIGLVINPQGISELFKGNKYPGYYPD